MSALSTSMHHWCPLMIGHVVRAQRVASMVVLVRLACCLWHCWAVQPPGFGEERNRSRASKERPIRGNLSQIQRGPIVSSQTWNWVCHFRLTIWTQIMPVYICFTPHVCWQLKFFIPMHISANNYHICTCCSTPLTFTWHKQIVVIYGLSISTKVFHYV